MAERELGWNFKSTFYLRRQTFRQINLIIINLENIFNSYKDLGQQRMKGRNSQKKYSNSFIESKSLIGSDREVVIGVIEFLKGIWGIYKYMYM